MDVPHVFQCASDQVLFTWSFCCTWATDKNTKTPLKHFLGGALWGVECWTAQYQHKCCCNRTPAAAIGTPTPRAGTGRGIGACVYVVYEYGRGGVTNTTMTCGAQGNSRAGGVCIGVLAVCLLPCGVVLTHLKTHHTTCHVASAHSS